MIVAFPARNPDCASSEGRVYQVVEGDSLWRIAEHELGAGQRWRELFAANRGRRMPDGQRLDDPGLIRPGWQLLLPTVSEPPPAKPAPSVPELQHQSDPPTPPAPPSQATEQERQPPAPDAVSQDRQHDHRTTVELPSGSMVGLSLAVGIAAALVVAGLRRRRRRRPLWPPAPQHGGPPAGR
jgi:hypothetical protein